MADVLAYAGLFVTALIAATIFPMQSEAALAAMLLNGYALWIVLAVASVGNVLGSSVNWLLGWGIEKFRTHRWFPVSDAALARAQVWYQHYGKWSLLLSWVPIIGDPITVAAGVLREPFPVFLALVTVAKVGRYAAVAAITLNLV